MSKRMIHAPMACTIVDVLVSAGDSVRAGQPLLIVEAMKMEHEIRAEADGTVLQVAAWAGEAVSEGDLLLQLAAEASTPAPIQAPAQAPTPASAQAPVPASVRADLQEVRDRHALTLDAARPEAVAKRHALGLRTAR